MICLNITPRDPIIARDGRPFGLNQGRNMNSLPWLYPSVLSGSLRTLVGKLRGGRFDDATVSRLKEMHLAGPFPMKDGKLFLPAPKDIMFWIPKERDCKEKITLRCLVKRPFRPREGEGCDLPAGLFPVGPLQLPDEEIEGVGNPAFWSMSRIAEWLSHEEGVGFAPPPYFDEDQDAKERDVTVIGEGFLSGLSVDQRTHVKIDPFTLAAEEHKLFTTSALTIKEGFLLSARVENAGDLSSVLENLDEHHPLGGERRLVHWSRSMVSENAWSCPDKVRQGLKDKTGIRMVLASPGSFGQGWKPPWLKDDLIGHPPDSRIKLQLVGAVIDRWQPVSGWSLEHRGPKAVRRLVPPGSVYFFTIVEGDPQELVQRFWLQSVCDEPQDRRDGFGLALWGVWDDTDFKGGD